MKVLVALFIFFSAKVFALESTIKDLVVPLYESIQVADYSKQTCTMNGSEKKCKPLISTLKKGSKIRIVSRNKTTYKIEVFSDEGESQGIFFTSIKFANKALNWNAVNHTLKLLNDVKHTGVIEDVNCKYGIHLISQMKDTIVTPESLIHQVYSTEDLNNLMLRHSTNADGSVPSRSIRPIARPSDTNSSNHSPQTTAMPEEDLPPYNGEYLPGCEVLKEDQVQEENRSDLKKCIQSMRLSIARGARNSDGSLNRTNLYANMFKNLNPKEQAFAAKVFTSIGEVETLNNEGDYMSIMKVLKNRARFARQSTGDTKYNELDAALSEWQFSMYNSAEPGWRKILDPGKAISSNTLDKVIDAMVTLDSTDTSKYDNVYMYHANYVTPKDWDWSLLSEPFSMDFGNGDKTKSSGRAYHRFYTPSNGMRGVYIGNFRKRRRDAN